MGIVRDFSVESIANIREIIRVNVDEEEQWKICDWVSDWFIDDLDISDYLNNVEEYQAQMVDKYDIGSKKFDEILKNVHNLDSEYASKFQQLNERILAYKKYIVDIAYMLSPKKVSQNLDSYKKDLSKIKDDLCLSINEYLTNYGLNTDIVNSMASCYGFKENDIIILKKAYDAIKADCEEKDFKHDFFAYIAALCVNYDGDAFRWWATGDLPKTTEAIAYLKKIGLREYEVKQLFMVINKQHDASNYEKVKGYGLDFSEEEYNACFSNEKLKEENRKDFAHEMIALTIFNTDTISNGFLNLITGGEIDILSSFKGDAYSDGFGEIDQRSDIDVINIQKRLKDKDIFEVITTYNQEVLNGKVNRVNEFLKNYGNGDIKKGRKKIEEDLRSHSLGSDYISGDLGEDIKNAFIINGMTWGTKELNEYNMNTLDKMQEKQNDIQKKVDNNIKNFLKYIDNNMEA